MGTFNFSAERAFDSAVISVLILAHFDWVRGIVLIALWAFASGVFAMADNARSERKRRTP